jgi:hypothetical protein
VAVAQEAVAEEAPAVVAPIENFRTKKTIGFFSNGFLFLLIFHC